MMKQGGNPGKKACKYSESVLDSDAGTNLKPAFVSENKSESRAAARLA
jgi:hypothetical protein